MIDPSRVSWMLTLGEASHEIIIFTTPRPPFCKETHLATLRGWGYKDRRARLVHSCPRHPRAGVSHVRKDAILDVQATGASGVSRVRDYLTMTASVQFSRSVVSESLRPHESHHARPPCPSPTPGVHSDSHPSSRMSGPKCGLPRQAHTAHRTMRDNIC